MSNTFKIERARRLHKGFDSIVHTGHEDVFVPAAPSKDVGGLIPTSMNYISGNPVFKETGGTRSGNKRKVRARMKVVERRRERARNKEQKED